MAKKRDRRAGLSSDSRSNRVETPIPEDQTKDSANSFAKANRRRLRTILFLLFIVSPAISLFIYRRIYAPISETTAASVYQRGLVKTEVNYKEILTEHTKVTENSSVRNFKHPVLAYITPWNSKGYDLAKKFNYKLTHISPVWYDLKSEGASLALEGRHNADKGWISELRMKGDAQILPRVVLEAIPMSLLKKKQRDKAINLIITECSEMEYDGIVLESWSRWAAYGVLQDPDMRNMALKFIQQLGQAMHSVSLKRKREQSLQLVYVIGPPRSEELQEYDFGPEDLKVLSDAVDGYSLMTYDFSGPQNPGPNAPLKWIHSILHLLLPTSHSSSQSLAQKIFVGMNFYGNDFSISGGLGGGPIIGREYISLLERNRPSLQWEKISAEHFFLYYDDQHVKHVVFYPTLMSIAKRLEEAGSWGAGISIWEIGQGLDYFFDIL